MSQLLQVATRAGGAIPHTDGVSTPSYIDQGIPYAVDGSLAVDNLGVIDHYHQALPFTAEGRLSAAIGGVVDSIQPGGIPLDASGFICLGIGAVDHYSAGIPYTATNQIAVV